ncbi:hypothetical protein ACFRCG_19440 [Embleya sp. NPDC056575]|uniref:hypothetical protein n=1 Tax=unclassified Embleya TaxID=2699296 RepID=UPI0036C1DDF0
MLHTCLSRARALVVIVAAFVLLGAGAAVPPARAAGPTLTLGFVSSHITINDVVVNEAAPTSGFDLWLTSSGGAVEDVRILIDTTRMTDYRVGLPACGREEEGLLDCPVGTVDGYRELPPMRVGTRNGPRAPEERFGLTVVAGDGRVLVAKTEFTVSKDTAPPNVYGLKNPVPVQADGTVDAAPMFRNKDDQAVGDLVVHMRTGPGVDFRERFGNCYYSSADGGEPPEALCVATGPFSAQTTYRPTSRVGLGVEQDVVASHFTVEVRNFERRNLDDWLARHGRARRGDGPALVFTEVDRLDGALYRPFGDLYDPKWNERMDIRSVRADFALSDGVVVDTHPVGMGSSATYVDFSVRVRNVSPGPAYGHLLDVSVNLPPNIGAAGSKLCQPQSPGPRAYTCRVIADLAAGESVDYRMQAMAQPGSGGSVQVSITGTGTTPGHFVHIAFPAAPGTPPTLGTPEPMRSDEADPPPTIPETGATSTSGGLSTAALAARWAVAALAVAAIGFVGYRRHRASRAGAAGSPSPPAE